jgi:hypothetical protein
VQQAALIEECGARVPQSDVRPAGKWPVYNRNRNRNAAPPWHVGFEKSVVRRASYAGTATGRARGAPMLPSVVSGARHMQPLSAVGSVRILPDNIP